MLRRHAIAALLFVLFAPPLAAQVGSVAFENSGAAGAQADFAYALAQLHNFEYEDAAEAFRRAQVKDPTFAMAYWGEAMTHNHPIWMEQDRAAALAVLARAEAAGAKPESDRESAYLRALETLYGGDESLPKEERDRRYAAAMGALAARFPDDEDAAAFHGLALLGTAHAGRDFTIYMRAAAVLEEAWPGHDGHPGIVHYLIHSYDDPIHAPLGLRAARVYAKLAPVAGHAQHMTSHIFLALGMWPETVAANEAALAAMNTSRQHHGEHTRACGHYASWLHYGYLQQGNEREARRVLDGCRAEVGPGGHALGADPLEPDRSSIGSFAMMRLRHVLDAVDPGEIATWSLPETELAGPLITDAFTRLYLAARRRDLPAARTALAEVTALRERVVTLGAGRDASYAHRAEILVLQSEALIAHLDSRPADAARLAREAVAREESLPYAFGPPLVDKPSHELLGELLLAAGDKPAAATAFEESLARAPGRRLSQAGLAAAQGDATL